MMAQTFKAQTFKGLGALLSYPTEDLQQAVPEILALFATEGLVPAAERQAIAVFLGDFAATDIYELQERYFALFDRSRTLSLHLFEHIHGESRDRGQAMADLKALYHRHGLEMAEDELPDFLPLFLEFLSQLPLEEARGLLAEPARILRALADRLKARETGYAAVMGALAVLAQAGSGLPMAEPAGEVPVEDPNDLAALDAAWEEAAVTFGAGAAMDSCNGCSLHKPSRGQTAA